MERTHSLPLFWVHLVSLHEYPMALDMISTTKGPSLTGEVKSSSEEHSKLLKEILVEPRPF